MKEKQIKTPKGNLQKYVPKMEVLELSNIPTLIITKEVQSQILYYHSRIGTKEWCGFLLFEQQGDLLDIDSMILTTKYIHIIDIGTETKTVMEDYDPFEITDDLGEQGLEYKMGKIHTHHSMQCFHSAVDWQALHENTQNYPFYLSLIVNFEGKYEAKIAFIGKESPKKLILNSRVDNIKLSLKESEDMLIVCDCKIVLQQEEHVINRFNKLLEKKKEQESKMVPVTYAGYIRQFPIEKWDWWREQPKPKSKITLSPYHLDELIIKVISADFTAVDQNLLFALKRVQTNIGEQKDVYLDLVEDNYENIVNKYFEKELDLDEFSEVSSLIVQRLRVFKEIEIMEDLVDLFDIYIDVTDRLVV
jgi:proteasome lid subunit RPN8/RPN11